MRLSILSSFIFWAGIAYGAVVHVPIKSSVVLKPNEAYTIASEATEVMEIVWQAVQLPRCTTNCVQATDLAGGINYTIATPLEVHLDFVRQVARDAGVTD
jgi:hypothetical protein